MRHEITKYKRRVNKHKKGVELFFQTIEQASFTSTSGVKLKKRILRYKDELFMFMNFDNVPWSNNTAEHAFRHFADYRRVSNGIYTENGLNKYLILLSIFETCRYKEIDFFLLLISREKYIENYERKYTNRGHLRKRCNVHRMIKEFK